MDDHTDDRDPDLPPVGTPEELEEALKWLEDLTARQGKSADKSAPAPAASLDSPFRGLIDSEDGDLPDWLRELPLSQQLDDNEPESRLDWLAKMAQQESIEELPTLEWRRLSEPAQSAILSGRNIDMPAETHLDPDYIEDPEPDVPEDNTADYPIEAGPGPANQLSVESLPEPTIDKQEEALLVAIETTAKDDAIDSAEQPEPTPIEPTTAADHIDETPLGTSIAPVTMGLDEILSLERPAGDMAELLPDYPDEDEPLDDLDAAMAWIEELAASQNAPIEEVPSVADRALASKLMMEAGLTPIVSPLDELGSDSDFVEGLTPTHPFIEEEDFADTVVLVETLAADREFTPEATPKPVDLPEIEVIDGPLLQPETREEPEPQDIAANADEFIDPKEGPEELSFEEAMAFLDEIAGTQTSAEDETIPTTAPEAEEMLAAEPSIEASPPESAIIEHSEEVLTEVIDDDNDVVVISPYEADREEFETLSADDVPWLDTPAEEMIVPSPVNLAENENTGQPGHEGLNGVGYGELEMTLLSLDALALPPGRTLDDVAAKLTTAQMAPWRNVDSALDWLEQALNKEATPVVEPTSELDDASLIEQMPEDPDAVLAWLEQIAAQEDAQAIEAEITPEESSVVITEQAQSEPFVEELAEADLLNMPDDPDEAMAWLEGLARGGRPASPAAEKQVTVDGSQPEEFAEAEAAIEEKAATIEPKTGDDELLAEDTGILDEPAIEAEIEAIDLPEQQAGIAGADQGIINIDDEAPAEEEIVAEEMSEPSDEESAAYEQPAEVPAVVVEEKPPLPSWLDLLKPLD